MDYTKMSALVDKDFTVQKVNGYKFKKWDDVAKTMLVSDTYVAEHQKKWEIETDKGKMDVSQSQIGTMLESVSRDGQSNIIGKSFRVKSNGKTGIDIRYYINPVVKPISVDEDMEDEINLSDIPF